MAIPYTSGDFTLTRCIDHWVEYPFIESGDAATKIYYMRCMVNTANYAPLTTGTGNLTSAATAGVIALPSGFADATARFCEDTSFTSTSGGTSEFTRVFANVPASRDEYESITVSMPEGIDSGAGEETLVLGGSYTLKARFAHSYATSVAALTVNQPFKITFTSGGITFEVGYVRDSPNATSPTYTAFYGSTERVAQATTIRRWKGDIFEAVTPYIKPSDVR